MFKKIIAWALLITVTATVAVGGTLAYLTDRDSEANVFTTGDVDITLEEKFEQESELLPGKTIEKDVQIKNEGPNDAWVWYTYAIPQGIGDSLNLTFENESEWTKNATAIGTKEVDGVIYDVYAVLHNDLVDAGATTGISLSAVQLDPSVDITPEGDLYKVEAGVTTPLNWNVNTTENPIIFVNAYAIQKEGFDTVEAAYEAFAGQWGNMVDAGTYDPSKTDTWDGTADTSWYNDTDTVFALTTSEQLAGLAELVDGGNNFAGKTIELAQNMDLYAEDANGERICFDPIGSYRNDMIFEGTFDGQGHTINNMTQNTWALDNGYYYTDCGLGLFGAVENATIKNLVMNSASISGESALCGTVAAVAGDNVTFENIKVTNTEVADYQYYAGGIVGWAGGKEQYINCVVDASTTIAAQWGDFNNANGGIIGGIGSSSEILIKDSTVACRIDGYNDVTSAYEWYSYRRSGMLIGDTGAKDDPDGDNVGNAIAPNLTCENVTVIYGDWANYHYCQFTAKRYPWVRVEAGTSNSAYSNPRYGHPTDANGNEVVDENHVHNDGEKHNELIVFDQLYGGATGDRYCTYGTATHDGVTVIYNNK